jgi:hypothetical protein
MLVATANRACQQVFNRSNEYSQNKQKPATDDKAGRLNGLTALLNYFASGLIKGTRGSECRNGPKRIRQHRF